jgi:hypothetical protein
LGWFGLGISDFAQSPFPGTIFQTLPPRSGERGFAANLLDDPGVIRQEAGVKASGFIYLKQIEFGTL